MLRKLNTPAIHPDYMPLLLISNKLTTLTLSYGKPFAKKYLMIMEDTFRA